jgi:hypothetical protein
MRYQLILQFTANTTDEFDQLVALEEKLIEGLNGTAVVDGHDFGSSEFNIFILTDEPVTTFEKAHQLICDQQVQYNMRAAYRDRDSESYMLLWPVTLVKFTVS